jgi:alkyldihydroxyacetonephosphate synthase
VTADAETAAAIVAREGGEPLGEGPARAWFERRYAVSYKQSPVFRAGVWNDTMEVAAPWSTLATVYRNVRRALAGHALVMAHLSHAYPDGCSIYFTFVGASKGPHPEVEHAAVWRDALQATLESGGVMSHHHGIGRLRKEALARELGPGGIEAHAALKRAWDPSGVMNPGSAFDPEPFAQSGAADRSRSGDEAPWLVDVVSGLVRLRGNVRLDDAERALHEQGLTLGLAPAPNLELDAWIAAGMAGLPDPFLDPVEQRLAGLDAVLASGARIHLPPAPRRATGPDLAALFVGAEQRIGHVEHAWLRARPVGDGPARSLPDSGERTPALDAAEARAFDELVARFR